MMVRGVLPSLLEVDSRITILGKREVNSIIYLTDYSGVVCKLRLAQLDHTAQI